jgi:hypothetical protein
MRAANTHCFFKSLISIIQRDLSFGNSPYGSIS